MKNGRPYYYVREMARVNGKPKVTNQVYLGSLERILEMAKGKANLPRKIQAQEFGSLWLANLVEQHVDLAGIIDKIVPQIKESSKPSVGEYFVYAVYNRISLPVQSEPCLIGTSIGHSVYSAYTAC